MKKESDILLVGAHTSTQGGVHNALYAGQEIGATTAQIFTSNQRQWAGRLLGTEEIEAWQEALEKTGLVDIMSHDSYLINLGSPKEESLQKSRRAFVEEIERCHKLDIAYLNFHPGAALDDTASACLDRIVESLVRVEDLAAKGRTRLLLEMMAGQGSTVGHRFEHMAYVIDKVKERIPIGVCIDTCHLFAAGYDMRTAEACDATLQEFDRVIGLEHLYAFHTNDSMKPFASRRDRHAELGKGEIGMECFQFLMQDARTKSLPKYLETPGGMEVWKEEIKLLRRFAQR
ncbi:deoxyribonuclease IV [Simkania negevensis]|uniref:Probable endonuclease 4 n=1 Tax=Simkania negevensis TaxID=83561 RepID=A0ABS3AST7_9BACT|nr:deoxyribonuclease IV [Simkania negevensis]